MTAGFLAHGILALLGTALAVRTSGGALVRVALLLAALHAVGITIVAAVPGSPSNADTAAMAVHVAGAGMAIIGGNAAVALAAPLHCRRLLPRSPLPLLGITLGGTGLAAAAMLELDTHLLEATLLPDGAWERLAVYPIQAAELTAGVAVLRRTSRPRR